MAENKPVVIVTGGGSGIGSACCTVFARAGYMVIVAGRTLSKVEAIAETITQAGGEAIALEVDVSQAHSVEDMISATITRCGRIDVLLNSAGISPNGRITEISEADWDACIDIDLKSIFLTAKYVIPHMMARGGGVILNVAGTFGIRPGSNKPVYAAAKAGAINLSRAIALDYARENIRCNAICPGFIDTPINAGFEGDARDAFLDARQPLRGIITAEEVAEMALYLAGDAARMVTGQTFVIDGGQQAGLFSA